MDSSTHPNNPSQPMMPVEENWMPYMLTPKTDMFPTDPTGSAFFNQSVPPRPPMDPGFTGHYLGMPPHPHYYDYDNHHHHLPPYKQVKKRKRLTPDRLALLVSVFQQEQKPNADKRRQLSEQTGMTPREVQVWFQNRRAKYKRERAIEDKRGPMGTSHTTDTPSPPATDSQGNSTLAQSQLQQPAAVPTSTTAFVSESSSEAPECPSQGPGAASVQGLGIGTAGSASMSVYTGHNEKDTVGYSHLSPITPSSCRLQLDTSMVWTRPVYPMSGNSFTGCYPTASPVSVSTPVAHNSLGYMGVQMASNTGMLPPDQPSPLQDIHATNSASSICFTPGLVQHIPAHSAGPENTMNTSNTHPTHSHIPSPFGHAQFDGVAPSIQTSEPDFQRSHPSTQTPVYIPAEQQSHSATFLSGVNGLWKNGTGLQVLTTGTTSLFKPPTGMGQNTVTYSSVPQQPMTAIPNFSLPARGGLETSHMTEMGNAIGDHHLSGPVSRRYSMLVNSSMNPRPHHVRSGSFTVPGTSEQAPTADTSSQSLASYGNSSGVPSSHSMLTSPLRDSQTPSLSTDGLTYATSRLNLKRNLESLNPTLDSAQMDNDVRLQINSCSVSVDLGDQGQAHVSTAIPTQLDTFPTPSQTGEGGENRTVSGDQNLSEWPGDAH
ncbi:hypothetical protein IWQ62_004177 [Dispira parvispora]|uniref:Homeobox domain-containing protein n=1 Tax=Dispira parvispora TaxID=1520584 RepID=A0A9W8APJ8_9FUNG|nr:hypothetical protein IWQ62_004177 [Dispira parvispora]